jgi:3-isopropylmalate/(R)-2-methylmalate dehydratase small subunit
MKTFGGPVLFLDRSDINTDEIIPAKYLTEVTRQALKPFLLEDLNLDGFDPAGQELAQARVIVTRALEVNGITVVIAESFARIFRQNMFNCGMLAIELPKEKIDQIFSLAGKERVECSVAFNKKQLSFSRNEKALVRANFSLLPFDEALVKAGGWVEFADARY